MIGRLRGILLEKQAPDLLIEVAGVGYEVQLPLTSFYQLPATGAEAIIYTHFVVREDAQLLYGFVSQNERALFRQLIKANGVGPKLALRIVTELKGKSIGDGLVQTFVPSAPAPRPVPSVSGEAVAALMGLGLAEPSARRAVEQAVGELGPEADLSAVIKAALKDMGR